MYLLTLKTYCFILSIYIAKLLLLKSYICILIYVIVYPKYVYSSH